MPASDDVSRRRFLKASGGVATAAALAGCSGGKNDTDQDTETDAVATTTESDSDADDGSGPQDQEGSTLRLINGTMDSMDPVEHTLANASEVTSNIYDPLIYNPNGTLEVESLIATEWEVSDDGTVYTFHLKEGVQYHDDWGEVTAQDVVYAWERLAASENSRRDYYILDDLGAKHETVTETNDEGEEKEVYKPGSLAMEAVDDYTVRIELEQPYHDALGVISSVRFAPLPEGILGDIDGYDGEMSHKEFAKENPIGAGPFEFDMWRSDQEAGVSKFEDYHGDGASIDGVHWQVIEDSNAIYNYAMNKNVDMFNIPTAQYDPNKVSVEDTDDKGRMTGTYGPLRNGDTALYNAVPGLSVNFIGFNCLNVEKAARQATAMVLDHELLAEDVFKGRDVAGYHMTPPSAFPGGPEGYDEHAQEYPYGYQETQIDQARQLMEEAGYSSGDKYEFTFTIYDDSTAKQLANQIRDRLSAVHVDMEIETAPFATMIDRRKQGKLDMFLSGWGMGRDDPASVLALLYPPNTDLRESGSVIETNWVGRGKGTDARQKAAEAWETINNNPRDTEEDAEKREQAYIQMEEAMWEDVPFICFGHDTYERFRYDWIDIPPFGPTGGQRYDKVTIDTDQQPS